MHFLSRFRISCRLPPQVRSPLPVEIFLLPLIWQWLWWSGAQQFSDVGQYFPDYAHDPFWSDWTIGNNTAVWFWALIA
jgi:hypothetical protein